MRNDNMAAHNMSELILDWNSVRNDDVNMSGWTNGQDSHSENSDSCCCWLIRNHFTPSWPIRNPLSLSDHEERSRIVHAIIHNRSLDHLGSILGSGWDVNETLRIPQHILRIPGHIIETHDGLGTALGEAVRNGWTEGVKILLNAGAKCNTSSSVEKPLLLTLGMHPDVMELLLKHGADPNDHDDRSNNIPLLLVINRCRYDDNATKRVELLLEYGADPNVTSLRYRGCKDCPLSAAMHHPYDVFSALFKTLLHFGSDVNHAMNGVNPLLHLLVVGDIYPQGHGMFQQEQLDLYFLHGGDIDVQDGEHRTALERAVMENGNTNSIRWLIRHGADTSLRSIALIKDHFKALYCQQFNTTPLFLLQAGIRISSATHVLLSLMEILFSPGLPGTSSLHGEMSRRLLVMRDMVHGAHKREPQRKQHNFSASTSSHQVGDLEEFSDESLHVFPEVYAADRLTDKSQHMFDQSHSVLEFLSQAQSLQWYCRRCVRENLVSLQPSAVKTLPITAGLKRYILCHEI